jgi:DNA helicase II / ATP-dependent DNA helicase PcrA
MDVQSAYRQEEQRLKETFEEIGRQQAALGPRYFGDDFVEQVLDSKREKSRERLALLTKEPYFGRLDFQEEGQPDAQPLYIGKRGMDRPDWKQPYIIDWRAPVASLFYSFTGGDEQVEYEAPEGVIEGLVHRKRSLAVRDQQLDRVVDSYVRGEENLGVSDEFLLYRLGENKDNRLRDIVSTIQAEQDRIIRAPRNRALIIQGAAGSGKTTVALHRLAYLLYQYQDVVRAERMIIFAPNSMFLDYISGVLPELGVGNIQQKTFTEWALELLEQRVKLADEREALEQWFAPGDNRPNHGALTAGRYKGSLDYLTWIKGCLQQYELSFLPAEDFIPWEGAALPRELMREWFEHEYRHYPLAARRERLAARMNRWLEMELKEQKSAHFRELVAKSAKQRLKTFLKKLPVPNAVDFYKMLFGASKSSIQTIPVESSPPDTIVSSTRALLKKGIVSSEDLAPMLWIRQHFEGTSGLEFDHVVIDEAQDASPFQIAVLKSHMREPSFTILGDLAQGIHSYKGILRWEEQAEVFEQEQLSFHQLVQSYRSTMEIIEFANRIAAHAETGLAPAQPVFRSGKPVEMIALASPDEKVKQIHQYIDQCRTKGMRTIAIICRSAEACRKLHQMLELNGIDSELIEEGQREYHGGVSVVPAYLSKGLEFDAVLVVDADDKHYALQPLDAKLLYVACTRALHRLTLIYHGKPTELIDDGLQYKEEHTKKVIRGD